MVRYDTGVLYDNGAHYDVNVGVLTTDEKVIAGRSLAVPSHLPAWRARSFSIWGWDPAAWDVTSRMNVLVDDASRQATMSELGLQQETLSFNIVGPPSVDVEEGSWFALLGTVASPDGTIDTLLGVYRALGPASPDRDAKGTLYAVNATDWYGYQAQQLSIGGSWLPIATLQTMTTAYVDAGFEIDLVAGFSLFGNWLPAYVWYTATQNGGYAAPFHGIFWDDFVVPIIGDPEGPAQTAFQITSPGQTCRISDVLAWFWPTVAGYTLAYAPDGGLQLSGRTPLNSGYYVTTEDVAIGTVPLPWAKATRVLTRPQFYSVLYRTVPGPPPEGFIEGGPPQTVEAAATAEHWGSDSAAVETIQDVGLAVTKSGFVSHTAYAQMRLSHYTQKADVITLSVDSAFPPPPLGQLIAVDIRALAGDVRPIQGYYRLMSVTQPLSLTLATWTLEWWADLVAPLPTDLPVIATSAAAYPHAPNDIAVSWDHVTFHSAGDFIGIYFLDDPQTVDSADARQFVSTGNTASGVAHLLDVFGPHTYEVRGVFGSPPVILVGPMITVS